MKRFMKLTLAMGSVLIISIIAKSKKKKNPTCPERDIKGR